MDASVGIALSFEPRFPPWRASAWGGVRPRFEGERRREGGSRA